MYDGEYFIAPPTWCVGDTGDRGELEGTVCVCYTCASSPVSPQNPDRERSVRAAESTNFQRRKTIVERWRGRFYGAAASINIQLL